MKWKARVHWYSERGFADQHNPVPDNPAYCAATNIYANNLDLHLFPAHYSISNI